MGKLSPVRRFKKIDFSSAHNVKYYRLKNKYFFLYYSSTYNKTIGIQTSKRFLKKATQRNKLKRTISEYFRLHQKVLPCVNVIIGLRAPVDDVPFLELKGFFYQLIEELILRCKQL